MFIKYIFLYYYFRLLLKNRDIFNYESIAKECKGFINVSYFIYILNTSGNMGRQSNHSSITFIFYLISKPSDSTFAIVGSEAHRNI